MIADTPAHLADAKTSFEWLAISPDDPHLLESLSDALAGKPAAILKTPANDQSFLNGELLKAVDRSLEQHEINHIVLVGRSPAEDLDDQQEDSLQAGSDDSESIFDRILAGACSQNAPTIGPCNRTLPTRSTSSWIPLRFKHAVRVDRWRYAVCSTDPAMGFCCSTIPTRKSSSHWSLIDRGNTSSPPFQADRQSGVTAPLPVATSGIRLQ